MFGQAGHFNEDGTPQAGHEQDYLGPCQTPPPPTDVCPNIDGNQATVPDGMVKDEQGNCVTPPPPPTDVCPNIEGNQAEVPDGLVKDEQGNCVTPPPTGVEHLVVTKTAGTSWYKVYNWDVEKSVDKSQLDLKQGETGSVRMEGRRHADRLDRAEHPRGRHHHRREPERHGRDGRLLTDELPDTSLYCGANDDQLT